MIAWWMAQLALLGTLLAVAAFGAESALKVARRPTRWVWATALGLTALLGATAPMQHGAASTITRDLSLIGVAPATINGTAPRGVIDALIAALSATWSDVTTLLAAQVQRVWTVWNAATPDRIDRWMFIAWLLASVTLLIAFVAVHVRYQRRRVQWPLTEVHGTRVRVSRDTGPAVIGVTGAEIVVPQWLLSRDAQEQRLVIEHELEHVRQHDPLLLAAAQAVVILLPWHPAVWFMASRLRLAIELDCDRRVLQRGASARDYGTLLIDLTDHRTGFGAALPAFSCSPSHLERRLVAMTPKRLKYPLIRAVATTAFASLALLAACEAKLPTSDEMDRMTASSATAAAGRVALIDTATVRYFIDGRTATKTETDKLAAEQIASVNVTQKGVQNGGEVRIVTRTPIAGDSSPTRMTYVRTPPTPPIPPSGPTRTGFTGLMIVDGVITDPAIANSIAPDQIASVNVTKGASAVSQYNDPRAANGVITIVTRKGVKR
jgi:beta-lactamase regulating signal transducer with metallopeptidase domain